MRWRRGKRRERSDKHRTSGVKKREQHLFLNERQSDQQLFSPMALFHFTHTHTSTLTHTHTHILKVRHVESELCVNQDGIAEPHMRSVLFTCLILCSRGGSQSLFTSQWLSRKVRTPALAASAPRTLDLIRPDAQTETKPCYSFIHSSLHTLNINGLYNAAPDFGKELHMFTTSV